MKQKVFVLIGPSGSGKTTWAKNLIKIRPSCGYVSSDKIREELTGDERNQKINDVVFKVARARLTNLLRLGKDVIVDATNLKPNWRSSYCQIARDFNSEIIFVVFQTEFKDCAQRDKNRNRTVGEKVIQKQFVQEIYPTWEEDWDFIVRV